ncbi:MAG: hypothetical protein MMC33_003203 [Icmadophila ericetorum]|nr:hypothetical protein [Icmadophila ericetorum]
MAPSTPLRLLPERLVGVSTKMYFDLATTQAYVTNVSQLYASGLSLTIFLIPDFPSLSEAARTLESTPHILLGAQNCHYEDRGAYTGEVSPVVLKQVGCSIVELGHAERRRPPLNETNDIVAAKAQAAVRNHLIPLVCIGERERSQIVSEGVALALRECLPQMTSLLSTLTSASDVIFAYEPVWAIGAERPASADHVLAVVAELKRAAKKMGRSGQTRFLYGGSAGPGTWTQLKSGLDGLFLGRYAHDLDKLKQVIQEMEVDG